MGVCVVCGGFGQTHNSKRKEENKEDMQSDLGGVFEDNIHITRLRYLESSKIASSKGKGGIGWIWK